MVIKSKALINLANKCMPTTTNSMSFVQNELLLIWLYKCNQLKHKLT